jgi:hypothetical protein
MDGVADPKDVDPKAGTSYQIAGGIELAMLQISLTDLVK